MKDPLKDPGPLWEDDPIFSVVALTKMNGVAGRSTVSTVKLTKTFDAASKELKRMIDVVTERMPATIDRSKFWAHVDLKDTGVSYHFSIQKTRFV